MNTEAVLSLLDPALTREQRLAQVVAMLEQEAAAPTGTAEPSPTTVADDDLFGELLAELEELRHRNAVLARALGSCPNCWGEHDDCPSCHGAGGPGRRRPDPIGFEVLVAPAIARLRGRRREDPPSRTPNGGTP